MNHVLRYWLLTVMILLAVGIYKSINLLVLLGSLLLTLVLLNAYWAGKGLSRLRARRRYSWPIFAGTPFRLELELTNPARRPMFGLLLEDRPAAQIFRWLVVRLAAGQTLSFGREMTIARRGRHPWDAMSVTNGQPFGLVQRCRPLCPQEEVIVLPRLGRVHRGRLRRHLASAGSLNSQVKHSSRRHPAAQIEFHGLRSFRSGDSPRWIHWRTTARCGELMVREFEELPTDNLILIVETELDGAAVDALEDALSLAATICWEWCRQKGDRFVLIVAGSAPLVVEGETSPSLAVRLLEELAVQTGQERTDKQALLARLAETTLPAGPALLISLRPTSLAEELSGWLHRPVIALDAVSRAGVDYYEPPPAQCEIV